MANTYTQLHVHIVFSVRRREAMIQEQFRDELQKYMTGIIRKKHKLLAIYCMPDHVHILVGLNPIHSISELVREVKANSSKWINDKGILPVRFEWQKGYGAFSYSKTHVDNVIRYINRQPEHHRSKTYHQEYMDQLNRFGIEYDPRYVFDLEAQ